MVIPTNPRTEAQQANRHQFGGVGSTWHLLTEPQRALWKADARLYRTHGRPGSSAPLTGFQRYMQVNAKRVSEGLPLLEVPPSSFILHPLAFPEVSPLAFSLQPFRAACYPVRTRLGFRCNTVVKP